MKKADLAQLVQDELQGTRAQAERIVQMMFDAMADAMAKGNDVDIAGFGKFTGKLQAAREARNPRTGEMVKVAAKRVPKFKAGKGLKDKVAA
jgi:nucleoid DNA-binding protein